MRTSSYHKRLSPSPFPVFKTRYSAESISSMAPTALKGGKATLLIVYVTRLREAVESDARQFNQFMKDNQLMLEKQLILNRRVTDQYERTLDKQLIHHHHLAEQMDLESSRWKERHERLMRKTKRSSRPKHLSNR